MKRMTTGPPRAVVFLLVVLATVAASAEDPAPLANSSVIELHKLGLTADIINLKIQTSSCEFDLSVKGLKQLKQAGVPNEVISTMLRKDSGASPRRATRRES